MGTRSALFLATLGLMVTPPAAFGAEEVISFDTPRGKVVGTLSLPEGGPAPVVLLFHGFSGTRDELPVATTEDGVFSRTARFLAEAGYASLRIDFIGSGDSEGEFADTTFEGQVADGLKVVELMTADPRVKGSDLAVIGWSQGGLVATAVAGRSGVPDAVALWATPYAPRESFGTLFGAAVLEMGMATGDTPLVVTMPWGAEIGLKQGYFEGVMTFDPVAEIAAYGGPLLVAQGTLDTTVLPVAADRLIAAHEGTEDRFTAEMDHVFNAFTGPQTLDEMIGKTISFFDAQMK